MLKKLDELTFKMCGSRNGCCPVIQQKADGNYHLTDPDEGITTPIVFDPTQMSDLKQAIEQLGF